MRSFLAFALLTLSACAVREPGDGATDSVGGGYSVGTPTAGTGSTSDDNADVDDDDDDQDDDDDTVDTGTDDTDSGSTDTSDSDDDTDTGSSADDTVEICLEKCYDSWCGVMVINLSTGDDSKWIGQEDYLVTSDSTDKCVEFEADDGDDLKFNGFNYKDGAEDYADDPDEFDDWNAFLVRTCTKADDGGLFDADELECGQMDVTVDGVHVTEFIGNDLGYCVP